MPERSSALDVLIQKLDSIGELGQEDRQALAGLPLSLKVLDPGQNLLLEGDRPSQCCILLDGWMARVKSFPGGNTQIVALHMHGDLVDLQSLNMPVLDHSITALTLVQLACVPHATLRNLLAERPSLSGLLWRSTLIEAAVTRQWLLNIGQRSGQERIAHLLCEIVTRLAAIGLAHDFRGNRAFAWPLTQARLGQATGLSTVHVNRSLQALRGEGLVRMTSGLATILDWPKLRAFAEFDPGYLGMV